MHWLQSTASRNLADESNRECDKRFWPVDDLVLDLVVGRLRNDLPRHEFILPLVRNRGVLVPKARLHCVRHWFVQRQRRDEDVH
jgi:hypothetical protein